MPDRRPHIEVIARAVLTKGPWLLACKNIKGDYLYLPGGHVEFGEPAAVALARELKEEAGLKVLVGSLLLTTEGTFRTKKRDHHEINLMFHVEQTSGRRATASTPPPPVGSREKHIGFEWLDLRAIARYDLRPANIRSWLTGWHAGGPPRHCSTWNSAFEWGGKRSKV